MTPNVMFKGRIKKKQSAREKVSCAICHAAPPKPRHGRAVVPATHETRVTPIARAVLPVAYHVCGHEALRGTVAGTVFMGGRDSRP